MDNENLRICKQCKHVKIEQTPWLFFLGDFYFCKKSKKIDSVTGEDELLQCCEARDVLGACGVSGNLWESKEEVSK